MAYEDKDKKIEIRLRFIASHYFRTWFFLDLISCINFQWFEPSQIQQSPDSYNNKSFLVLRCLRLLKLIRLIKYNRSMSRILQIKKMNQGVKRMISVAITMFFLVHLMGCLFFLIARLDDFSP
jgi:hypothetical protein